MAEITFQDNVVKVRGYGFENVSASMLTDFLESLGSFIREFDLGEIQGNSMHSGSDRLLLDAVLPENPRLRILAQKAVLYWYSSREYTLSGYPEEGALEVYRVNWERKDRWKGNFDPIEILEKEPGLMKRVRQRKHKHLAEAACPATADRVAVGR